MYSSLIEATDQTVTWCMACATQLLLAVPVPFKDATKDVNYVFYCEWNWHNLYLLLIIGLHMAFMQLENIFFSFLSPKIYTASTDC